MTSQHTKRINTQGEIEETEDHDDIKETLTKSMEEKHYFTYRKLVVPMSMRSIYWKFFGFPATDDGSIIAKEKIVCILCKTQIAYNRNTSNLRMHLRNKHIQELTELEGTNPPKRPIISQEVREHRNQKKLLKSNLANTQHIYTTNVDGTIQVDTGIQLLTDPNIHLQSMEEDGNISQPLRIMMKNPNTHSQFKEDVTFILPDEHPADNCVLEETNTLIDVVAESIIVDLQLPEVVEGSGFQKLLSTLRSPCEIPGKKKLEQEIIPNMYANYKDSILKTLSLLNTNISLTVEQWQSNYGESFITFSIYYQNSGEISLDCKVLSTVHAPDNWEETHWETVFDALMLEWDLKINKITAVVVASSKVELIHALRTKGLTVIPCLLYTLHVCAATCFSDPNVSKVISKCRAIIGAIYGNSTAASALVFQEKLNEVDDNSLIMDHPKIWISTYNMLEQLLARRELITPLLDRIERVDCEQIDPNPSEWKLIEDLVAVLEPFKVTILTLSEEKMPLISLLKPLLWQLVISHLKIRDSDSRNAKSFKNIVSEMLSIRYSKPDVSLVLQIATTLDPRFKQLPYATDEDKVQISQSIKDLLIKLVQEEDSNLGSNGSSNFSKLDDSHDKKRKRMSGMELLLGDQFNTTKSSMSAEEKADLEMVQYQSEPTAALDYCPLQWWANNVQKCQHLAKLAKKYNCVPVCCAPPSRIPAKAQIHYDTRRAALPPHLVDRIIFLHENYKFSV